MLIGMFLHLILFEPIFNCEFSRQLVINCVGNRRRSVSTWPLVAVKRAPTGILQVSLPIKKLKQAGLINIFLFQGRPLNPKQNNPVAVLGRSVLNCIDQSIGQYVTCRAQLGFQFLKKSLMPSGSPEPLNILEHEKSGPHSAYQINVGL